MRRFMRRSIATFCTLLILANMGMSGIRAQEATPIPSGPDTFFPPVDVRDIGWLLPPPFCTDEEQMAGEFGVGEMPVGGALTRPAAAPNQDLYLLRVTLPERACVGYDGHYLHDGAMIWFVQQGTIAFKTRSIVGLPAADVVAGHGDGSPIALTGGAVDLAEGDWISIDRAANYTYRNTGQGDAIIMMSVLESRPAVTELEPEDGVMFLSGCKGLCRGKR